MRIKNIALVDATWLSFSFGLFGGDLGPILDQDNPWTYQVFGHDTGANLLWFDRKHILLLGQGRLHTKSGHIPPRRRGLLEPRVLRH